VFSKKPKSLRKIGVIDLLYSVIKYHTNGIITGEVNEWNTQSQKITEKLGFKRI
jgi:RimJ/RimL family protein N-acetyltransferase